MFLGLPYHVALTYRAGETWIVNAHEGAPLLAGVAQFIHLFRMPAFFLIAGYFSALLLSRRAPGEWLNGRLRRLAIPFLTALLTLNPLMNLACELSNFALPQAAQSWVYNSSNSAGYWIRHLWFIIVLLYFSAIAAGLAARFPKLASAKVPDRLDAHLARNFTCFWLVLAAIVGVWEAVSVELFYMGGLATQIPQQLLRLDESLIYLPYFALGFVTQRAPALQARLYRMSPVILITALVFTVLSLVYGQGLWPPYGRFLEAVAGLCLTQLVLLVVKRLADRPNALVAHLVDASFVIYLFHMPIITGLVVLMQPLPMPVILKAMMVLILTAGLSWVAWMAVVRVPLLRLLYDGITPKGAKRAGGGDLLAAYSTQSSPISR